MNKNLQEAKRADIVEIARAAGYKIQKAGNGRFLILCPFHSENTPSCHLHTTGKFAGRFHCYGCEADGDSVDLYAQIHSTSKGEAIRALSGNIDLPKLQPLPQIQKQERSEVPAGKYAGLYADFLNWCKGYEQTEQKAKVLHYLRNRGFWNEAIRAGNIAAVPDDLSATSWLSSRKEEAVPAGLLSRSGRFTFSGSPLLLPCLDPSGRIMAITARRIEGNGPKYRNLPGVERYPFGAHSLEREGRVSIVEGPLDCVAALAIMKTPCLALGGLNIPDPLPALLEGRSVVLTLDNDEAGQNAWEKISEKLQGYGLPVLRGKYRNGAKDGGEYLLQTEKGKLAIMEEQNPALENLSSTFNLKIEE